MSHTVDGTFLRPDYSEYISEAFVKRYHVDVKNWIAPFGYFDSATGGIIHNGDFPDGTYIIIGKVQYPGKFRMSSFSIMQFNLARVRGIDFDIAREFNPYPDLPEVLKANLAPKFPMFKIEAAHAYKVLLKPFTEIADSHLTMDELKARIFELPETSAIRRLYSLRLAALRDLEKVK